MCYPLGIYATADCCVYSNTGRRYCIWWMDGDITAACCIYDLWPFRWEYAPLLVHQPSDYCFPFGEVGSMSPPVITSIICYLCLLLYCCFTNGCVSVCWVSCVGIMAHVLRCLLMSRSIMNEQRDILIMEYTCASKCVKGFAELWMGKKWQQRRR